MIGLVLCQMFCQIIRGTFVDQVPDKDSLVSVCFVTSREPVGSLCVLVHVPSGKLLEPSCV